MRTKFRVLGVLLIIAAGSSAAIAAEPKRSGFESRFPAASALGKYVGNKADAALDAAVADTESETWTNAEESAETAFKLGAAYGTPRDVDAFREAVLARRLLRQMEPLDPADRQDLLKYLRAHDELARSVAFTIRDGDDVPGVYRLLDKLRKERPKQVDALPNLAVALSVVRDRPLERHINENKVTGTDPLAVFDFYVAHEHQMLYGLKDMPVELLIYVVDTTATVDEMNWALTRYGGTADVGKLFFTIKYDTAYFEGKSPKKLDKAGFSLPHILQYGGVCVDQAYFATTVGKSIGVPTAIATATSAEVGHAWVGFLKETRGSAAWNFDSGRYDEYKGIRGNVTDPQTGQSVADSSVSMVGDVIGTTAVQRQSAVAMIDAARVVLGRNAVETGKTKSRRRGESDRADGETADELSAEEFTAPAIPPELAKSLGSAKPRSAVTGGLELIETGLKQYVSYAPGWELVATMADNDVLSADQTHRWADMVQKLCGQKHPDFAVAVLTPMVETVKDPVAQSALWDAVFALVQQRADLAAGVRLKQGDMWRKRADYIKAGQCYEDVIERYINAGPFALTAVQGAEAVLKELGQSSKIVDLYAKAYKLVAKPGITSGTEFAKQSNWYKVREAYAKKLEEAGQTAKADEVRNDDGKSAAAHK
jgi:hypothetical protein